MPNPSNRQPSNVHRSKIMTPDNLRLAAISMSSTSSPTSKRLPWTSQLSANKMTAGPTSVQFLKILSMIIGDGRLTRDDTTNISLEYWCRGRAGAPNEGWGSTVSLVCGDRLVAFHVLTSRPTRTIGTAAHVTIGRTSRKVPRIPMMPSLDSSSRSLTHESPRSSASL